MSGVNALSLIANLIFSVIAIGLVLAHKGRDGGLGGPVGGGQAAVERPLTRALLLVLVLWAASGLLEAWWR